MDFEAWRCMHDDKLFCPDEGCSKSYGCARDHGWKPGEPTPEGCSGIMRRPEPTLQERQVKALEAAKTALYFIAFALFLFAGVMAGKG